ncbi:MAG: hypothetical protein Q7T03_09780 [Deltaproteobacteria bacterium]|nr:hypothetical protein [Deltaproteobacteria bacterium]
MVDKIDKPEKVSPYAIGGTTETKRDKPQDQRGQEDLPTYKKEPSSLYREKFQGELGVAQTIRIPVGDIQQFLFRRATPRHGSPTAEADLIWKDGKTSENVSFLLSNWQDFLKIKNLKTGEVIPEIFWNHGNSDFEITVRQGSPSGSWNMREMQKKPSLPAEAEAEEKITGTPWWKLGEIYTIGAIVIIILALAIYLMRI